MKRQLLMFVALLYAAVSFAYDGESICYGGLWYEVLSERDRTAKFVSYTDDALSSTGEITIPSDTDPNIGGRHYTVTEIADAFKFAGVTKVSIPGTVNFIWPNAFLSPTLKEIEARGYGCYSSKDGMLYKDNGSVLVKCPRAKESFDISNTTVVIDERAFYACDKLTSIELPSSVQSIGNDAFLGCSNLKSVTFPYIMMGSMGIDAFSGCGNLTSVILPCEVPLLGGGFVGCHNLKSVVMPKMMFGIEPNAFWGCASLESIALPEMMQFIVSGAFSDCQRLKKIYSFAPQPPVNQQGPAFDGVPTDAVVYVPKGTSDMYRGAEGWNRFSNYVEMGNFQVSLNNSTLDLAAGKTATLKADVVKDPDMSVGSVKWISYEPKIATVDDNGVVTAISNGEAHIRCIVTDNYGAPHSEVCVVNVTGNSAIENVIADPDPDAPVEVYNINGLKVADSTDNLPAGLYIVRQGKTVKKIIVK